MSIIRRAKEEETDEILAFLSHSLEMKTLFCSAFSRVHPLYFETFIEKEEEVQAVFLRLFGVWYLEAKETIDFSQAASFFGLMSGKSEICARKPVTNLLEKQMGEEFSKKEAPFLVLQKKVKGDAAESVTCREDLLQVCKLLQTSDTFAPCDEDEFYLTRKTLMNKGLARILVLRENETPIATASTLFESEDYAMLGAICTHPEMQGRGLATTIVRALCGELQDEGKTPMLAAYHPAALHVYQKLGFQERGVKGVLRF